MFWKSCNFKFMKLGQFVTSYAHTQMKSYIPNITAEYFYVNKMVSLSVSKVSLTTSQLHYKSTTCNKIQAVVVVCAIITSVCIYCYLLHHCYTWKLQSDIATSMHFCTVVASSLGPYLLQHLQMTSRLCDFYSLFVTLGI